MRPVRVRTEYSFAMWIALAALPCVGAERTDESLRTAVERVIYRLEPSGPLAGDAVGQATYHGRNPAQRLNLEFDAREARLQHPQGKVAFHLTGYGYGAQLKTPVQASPMGSENRVEYRRGEITEWYQNEASGLEQGFTLARRPARRHLASHW